MRIPRGHLSKPHAPPDPGTTATKGGSVSRIFKTHPHPIHSMKSENLGIIHTPSPSPLKIARRAPERFPLLRILLVPPARFANAWLAHLSPLRVPETWKTSKKRPSINNPRNFVRIKIGLIH